MFQFPGCPSVSYVFTYGCADMPQRGFPHSDIADSSRAHTPGRRFSQCITSFIGILCPGIPRVLLVASYTLLEYGEIVACSTCCFTRCSITRTSCALFSLEATSHHNSLLRLRFIYLLFTC